MRTSIELDEILIERALKLSKLKTKREVVQEALKSYVSSLERKELLQLKGRVAWVGKIRDMRSM